MSLGDSIKSIPALEEYKSQLDELFRKTRTMTVVDEIGNLFYDTVRINLKMVRLLPQEAANNFYVYRSREIKNELTANLSSAGTFAYPPSSVCKENGRLNLAGYPAFYGSDQVGTALAETHLTEACVRFLSVWSIGSPEDVGSSSFLTRQLPEKNLWKMFVPSNYNEMIKMARKTAPDKIPQLEYGYDWINRLFEIENEPYPLTSCLGHDLLYQTNAMVQMGAFFKRAKVNLVIYPSYVTRRNTCNIAINPGFVNRHMKLLRVYRLYISNVTGDNFSYEVMSLGVSDRNHITWHEATEQEKVDGIKTPRKINGRLVWVANKKQVRQDETP